MNAWLAWVIRTGVLEAEAVTVRSKGQASQTATRGESSLGRENITRTHWARKYPDQKGQPCTEGEGYMAGRHQKPAQGGLPKHRKGVLVWFQVWWGLLQGSDFIYLSIRSFSCLWRGASGRGGRKTIPGVTRVLWAGVRVGKMESCEQPQNLLSPLALSGTGEVLGVGAKYYRVFHSNPGFYL